jgi:ferredoxin-type protein NapG
VTDESYQAQRRREFFRESFTRLIGPVSDFLESRFDLPTPRALLRPPGALPEAEFLDTCYRCGSCVEACPAEAIAPLKISDSTTQETPVIDPDRAPCVICEGLDCMTACPSGALRLVESPGLIRMGLAKVAREVCVRSNGEDCTICVDRCPIGRAALRVVDWGPPDVLDPGCVGCGVCQHYCPTTPKAIVVIPL